VEMTVGAFSHFLNDGEFVGELHGLFRDQNRR
jgi:hypothetical protein